MGEEDKNRQTGSGSYGRTSDGFVVHTSVRPVQPQRSQPARPAGYRLNRPISQPNAPSLPRVEMGLPGDSWQRRRQAVFRRRRNLMQSWAVRGALSCAVLCLGVGGWLAYSAYVNIHKVFNGNGTTAAALQKNVNPNLLKGEGDGRVNILLLGNGGTGHEAPDLTDTIMVASIDPVNHKVALVSVPRDLYINLPGHGNMKLNAAFETGKYDYLGRIDHSNANDKAIAAGFASADQAIEQVLGITIHYNVLANFISFKKAVNTIGGVDVNVPEQLYDPTMAWENGWSPILARAGHQHFDGKQALLYVRSRETSSDFARSERQRQVITAMKDKVVSLGVMSNPVKISDLLENFGNNVKTDLSIDNAARVYQLTSGIADKQITSLGLGDNNSLVTTGRIGNQSVVLPTAGQDNYRQIHKFIRQHLPDGYIVKENAKVLVLDASGEISQAKAEAKELKSYGYNVIGVDRYPGQLPSTKLYDQSGDRAKYTRNYLQRRFNVKADTNLPSTVQSKGADFIIVLGQYEAVSR